MAKVIKTEFGWEVWKQGRFGMTPRYILPKGDELFAVSNPFDLQEATKPDVLFEDFDLAVKYIEETE